LVTDCHIILARWRNHFSQLFSVHGVNEQGSKKHIQQKHWCLIWSAFEVEMANVTLKGYKSPGIDQIPAELIKAGF
jgi:hypothetical protein